MQQQKSVSKIQYHQEKGSIQIEQYKGQKGECIVDVFQKLITAIINY
jgi:hypothetical protein